MAEWVNKGNFSRGLAHKQCLRRDFVTHFFAGFGASAMSPVRTRHDAHEV